MSRNLPPDDSMTPTECMAGNDRPRDVELPVMEVHVSSADFRVQRAQQRGAGFERGSWELDEPQRFVRAGHDHGFVVAHDCSCKVDDSLSRRNLRPCTAERDGDAKCQRLASGTTVFPRNCNVRSWTKPTRQVRVCDLFVHSFSEARPSCVRSRHPQLCDHPRLFDRFGVQMAKRRPVEFHGTSLGRSGNSGTIEDVVRRRRVRRHLEVAELRHHLEADL